MHEVRASLELALLPLRPGHRTVGQAREASCSTFSSRSWSPPCVPAVLPRAVGPGVALRDALALRLRVERAPRCRSQVRSAQLGPSHERRDPRHARRDPGCGLLQHDDPLRGHLHGDRRSPLRAAAGDPRNDGRPSRPPARMEAACRCCPRVRDRGIFRARRRSILDGDRLQGGEVLAGYSAADRSGTCRGGGGARGRHRGISGSGPAAGHSTNRGAGGAVAAANT